MALYVVVHHRRDSKQPWANDWIDDDRLKLIQTTVEIGNLCKQAKSSRTRVFVHRCALGANPPVICCSAEVVDVNAVDKRTMLVTFAKPEILGDQPPVSPPRGTNFYERG
jgi:hypothetical protein